MLIVIALIGVIFALTAACGSSVTEPAATASDNSTSAIEKLASNPTAAPDATAGETEIPTEQPAPISSEETETAVTQNTPSSDASESPNTGPKIGVTMIPPAPTKTVVVGNPPTQAASPEPTEPPLINTPVPVSNTAPDFTLPSVQGPEYTLSSFQGEQPVAVVFYRGYW